MPEAPATIAVVADFLRRWEASGAAERANYQLFLSELCDLLGVARPEPTRPDDRDNAYVFERAVTFRHGTGLSSTGRIDLYKRGCFVLEAKQGSDRPAEIQPLLVREDEAGWLSGRRGTAVRGTRGWDVAMLKAKGQAEQYARALPVEEGWPPFLVVVDVGHAIELYSEFSCTGKSYLPFPDPSSYRIALADLAHAEVRQRLRLAWTTPCALDPAKHSAKATREVADRLARLAKSLEQAGHKPEKVGNFLKRCLFTMFAEDVGLIPGRGFTDLLESLKGQADTFAPMAESLWTTMKDGGFSPVLREKLLRFNGGLFEEAEALPIGEEQLLLLIQAGKADWRDVEPAIFGTLLERALDPQERHHLGAHYTPREYVERLVLPTVIEPLRGEWEAVLAAAVTLDGQGDRPGAVALVKEFHHKLCTLRILDPACGSGNFLYVTFEHLKRLEGEVLNALAGFGEEQATLELAGLTVDPHQLLGIEVNPRAAAITDMVLWIGYLQWHFRTRGHVLPPEPVIRKFHNIECRDAVLACDGVEPLVDDQGQPVTRWDGRTTRTHPVTGEQVPDETAQLPVLRYLNPRAAEWPEADYVVGNPPFIGTKRMKAALGDGYVEALRRVWKNVPGSADFVMYWWQQAAELTRTGRLRRFGFITTNSLTQTFNRKVVEAHLAAKTPLALAFGIPDHPWVDAADGADVRIAMTVGKPASEGTEGTLATVNAEREGTGEGLAVEFVSRQGVLHADLSVGANVSASLPLAANQGVGGMGAALHGAGFILDPETAEKFRGFGARVIKPYIGGRDLLQLRRERYLIDFSGLSQEESRAANPAAFQHVIDYVKPERDHNRRDSIRQLWWRFGWERPVLRKALEGLTRYIATTETAKHQVFQFIHSDILPDHKVVAIASDDSFVLGVLSSRIHVAWALASGGRMGVGNDPVYNKTKCFDTFPFPDNSDDQKQKVRAIAEDLDAHRKRQQALYPGLALTDMYNVLEKLRSGEPLTAREKTTHEQGLVSVLRQLHDDLDAAVFAAYGWPANLSDEEVLERLVALNRERAREEEQGVVRWLRPEYQRPAGGQPAVQIGLELGQIPPSPPLPKGGAREASGGISAKAPWPRTLPEQVQAVRAALAAAAGPVTAEAVARTFLRTRTDRVGELLATLAAIGQAREVEPGTYVG
jgi:restriction-modification enzyme MmeI-like protein